MASPAVLGEFHQVGSDSAVEGWPLGGEQNRSGTARFPLAVVPMSGQLPGPTGRRPQRHGSDANRGPGRGPWSRRRIRWQSDLRALDVVALRLADGPPATVRTAPIDLPEDMDDAAALVSSRRGLSVRRGTGDLRSPVWCRAAPARPPAEWGRERREQFSPPATVGRETADYSR